MLTVLAALAPFQTPEPLVFEQILDPAQQAPGEGLDWPVGAYGRADDDRLFVTDMTGTVRILRDGQLDADPFVDVSGEILYTGLAGLRASTLHPDFETNGHVYLWYDALNANTEVDLVLARVTVSATDPDRTDPATLVELLRIEQDERGHGGGAIAFGPDGMLWVGVGDGGLQDDPNCRSQDPAQLFGKMLRLDVDGGFPYAIPGDNPQVGVPGQAPEVAHTGFRHPWKWSFDRATGDLWIGDVGQWLREDVEFAPAGTLGLNFGWPVMEGSTCHAAPACEASIPACGDPAYETPLHELPHGPECSITGGYVYRGPAMPDLVGAYVFTDFCSRRYWALRRDAQGGAQVQERDVLFDPVPPSLPNVSSFGEDGDGELLLVDHGNRSLYRLRPPCGAATTCVGEPNVTGASSVLRWFGSSSLDANDVTVRVASLPPQSPTLLFQGSELGSAPLGNGTLCVGGQTVRIAIASADLAGETAFALDFTAPPFVAGPGRLEAGATWTFQAWYRDVGGPMGATFNFSSATTVTFCP